MEKVGRLLREVEQMPLASGIWRSMVRVVYQPGRGELVFPAGGDKSRAFKVKFVTDDGRWLIRRWEICDRGVSSQAIRIKLNLNILWYLKPLLAFLNFLFIATQNDALRWALHEYLLGVLRRER